MSPAEIAWRVRVSGRMLQDRRRGWPAANLHSAVNRLQCAGLPGLIEGLPAAMDVPAWRRAFNDAQAGRFAWFDVSWPTGEPPDWHLDPITGRRWPTDRFGPSIDYRHDRSFGDVKYVWELNRLQYLQPIAALAHATGEPEPADLVRRHVESWLDANAPFDGINWSSGIELGLRLVSLAIVATLVDLGPRLNAKLAHSLGAHGHWLSRYPSRFSSANNHAIAEALGLLVLGTTWPELTGAERWARIGRRILAREAERQILSDGVGAEQAIAYQCFTLEMLALAARLGADTEGRFAAAGAFLRALTDDAGHTPLIGDDDECGVFWRPAGGDRYACTLQGALGVSPVAAPPAWLGRAVLGPPKQPALPPDGTSHFPVGGYTVLRESGLHLVFDHGPLGYLSIAAHGHADALAVWLSLDGEPILIDAGTYAYHGAGGQRDALRGTAAHNTLTVEGADQSEIVGPFAWGRKARTEVLHARSSPLSVEAEHVGYVGRFGCRHRRTIVQDGTGFTIRDRLIGSGGPWRATVGFLLAPGLEVRYLEDGWSLGPKIRMKAEGPLVASVTDALCSPRMGSLGPTTRLLFGGMLRDGEFMSFRFSTDR